MCFFKVKSRTCSVALSPEAMAHTEVAFPVAPNWKWKDHFYDTFIQMRDDGRIKDYLAE
jgi:hypothetical protein